MLGSSSSAKPVALTLVILSAIIAMIEGWRVIDALREPSPEVFGACPASGPSRQRCLDVESLASVAREDWPLIALMTIFLLVAAFLLWRAKRGQRVSSNRSI